MGAPPSVEEAGKNLSAPEHAPTDPKTPKKERIKRRTGRTEPFATRVSPDFLRRVKILAAQDGLKMVEVLERALDAYEVSRKD